MLLELKFEESPGRHRRLLDCVGVAFDGGSECSADARSRLLLRALRRWAHPLRNRDGACRRTGDRDRAELAGSTGGLPPAAGEEARGSLAAAQQIGEQLGPQGDQLVAHAQAAFLHGVTQGLVVGSVVLLLGALFVAVRAPGRAESRSNATGSPIGAAAVEGA